MTTSVVWAEKFGNRTTNTCPAQSSNGGNDGHISNGNNCDNKNAYFNNTHGNGNIRGNTNATGSSRNSANNRRDTSNAQGNQCRNHNLRMADQSGQNRNTFNSLRPK